VRGAGKLRPSRLAAACVALLAALAAGGCGSDDDEGTPGDPPGALCRSERVCPGRAWLCFAAGVYSSCDEGGLCSAVTDPATGVPAEPTCAYPCQADADCEPIASGMVCLLDCENGLFNGHCVPPAVASELLDHGACTSASRDPGVAGESY
jgi:hypothetical protein